MTKLLIYIGENQKFDIDATVKAISSMRGALRPRRGNFIGSIFECEYRYAGRSTIVRISPEAETITAEGLGDESLVFALELQEALPVALNAIDMECSFNVPLRDFQSLEQLKAVITV